MKNKKPTLIFTCADVNNFPYSVKFINSLTKFHSPKDIDILVITNVPEKDALAKLPEGVKWANLAPYTKDDPAFFYRQKPIIMEQYIDEYELIIGMDSDSLVLGDISYLWKTKDYDVLTVLNGNRFDPQFYGIVELNQIGISPMEYFNCGLVASRSKDFIHKWKVACFSPQFDRMPYREQGILNILCYYGNYNVRCADHLDEIGGNKGWWGLVSKGEWQFAKLDKDQNIYVPQGQGDTPFPPIDTQLKVIHFGGGNTPDKMNYRARFSEDVINRIDYLISGDKK